MSEHAYFRVASDRPEVVALAAEHIGSQYAIVGPPELVAVGPEDWLYRVEVAWANHP